MLTRSIWMGSCFKRACRGSKTGFRGDFCSFPHVARWEGDEIAPNKVDFLNLHKIGNLLRPGRVQTDQPLLRTSSSCRPSPRRGQTGVGSSGPSRPAGPPRYYKRDELGANMNERARCWESFPATTAQVVQASHLIDATCLLVWWSPGLMWSGSAAKYRKQPSLVSLVGTHSVYWAWAAEGGRSLYEYALRKS